MNPAAPAATAANPPQSWREDLTRQDLQARSDASRHELMRAAHALREPLVTIGKLEQGIRKALPLVPQAMLALLFFGTLGRLTRVRRLGPLALITISLDLWRLWKIAQQFRALSALPAVAPSGQRTSLENTR